MTFDGIFIHHLCNEIAPLIVGGRIDKIHQPEKDELSLHIRGNNQNLTLFISVDSSIPYFTLSTQKRENPMAPPMFCMLLRKHLAGSRIISFEQMGYERVIALKVEARDDFGEIEIKTLFIEIMGKHSNMILTKEDMTIIDSIKRIPPDLSRVRSILPGLKYWLIESEKCSPEDPFDFFIERFEALKQNKPQLKLFKALYTIYEGFSPFCSKLIIAASTLDADYPIGHLDIESVKKLEKPIKEFMAIQSPSGYIISEPSKGPVDLYFIDTHAPYQTVEVYPHLYEALEIFYSKTNRALKVHQRLTDIKKRLHTILDRNQSKYGKLIVEQAEAEAADHYKMMGDILYANLYSLKKGMNKATLLNYYDPENKMIDIPLDVRLDPVQNAQRYFKKYSKLKTAQQTLEIQIKETLEMIDYLEHILTYMEDIQTPQEMTEILTELVDQGLIKKRYGKEKKKKTVKATYKTYLSSDGYEILVGKNNYQNDTLTLKIASNKDIWLHTKIIPGSHVIIRTKGDDIPETTLVEAAMIAAFHSKARQSDNVPVEYTFVKNVSKPSGAKPGMVIYTHNKTLYVTPDEKIVEALSSH
jgi:predicted ribosome quality control (RQC) complex YloA/Tae2 family protein